MLNIEWNTSMQPNGVMTSSYYIRVYFHALGNLHGLNIGSKLLVSSQVPNGVR